MLDLGAFSKRKRKSDDDWLKSCKNRKFESKVGAGIRKTQVNCQRKYKGIAVECRKCQLQISGYGEFFL